MELHIGGRGDKKPSTTMSNEIFHFYAFAAPGSSLARHRPSILNSGIRVNWTGLAGGLSALGF